MNSFTEDYNMEQTPISNYYLQDFALYPQDASAPSQGGALPLAHEPTENTAQNASDTESGEVLILRLLEALTRSNAELRDTVQNKLSEVLTQRRTDPLEGMDSRLGEALTRFNGELRETVEVKTNKEVTEKLQKFEHHLGKHINFVQKLCQTFMVKQEHQAKRRMEEATEAMKTMTETTLSRAHEEMKQIVRNEFQRFLFGTEASGGTMN